MAAPECDLRIHASTLASRSIPPVWSFPSEIFHDSLKLLPLFRRKHGLQAVIRLSTHLAGFRLGLLTDLIQLRAGLVEYRSHLIFLIGREIQLLKHALESAA